MTIGKSGVSVPTHVYKIVVRSAGSGHELLAFVAENEDVPGRTLAGLIKSVDWLEDRVGLDFFPDLGVEAEEAATPAMWAH